MCPKLWLTGKHWDSRETKLTDFPREQSSYVFCDISSKDEQFSSNLFKESFFALQIKYIIISLQVTYIPSNNENNKFN